jgi:hypothetical protein
MHQKEVTGVGSYLASEVITTVLLLLMLLLFRVGKQDLCQGFVHSLFCAAFAYFVCNMNCASIQENCPSPVTSFLLKCPEGTDWGLTNA